MRHTKYFLPSLRELNANTTVSMNVFIPMNTPVMLVRVDGQMRLKNLRGAFGLQHRHIEAVSPEQTKLL